MRSPLRPLALLVLALASGADAAPPRVGIAPAPVNDWDRDFLYADALKHARPFATAYDQVGSAPVPVDADGWPTDDCAVLVSSVKGLSHGRYTIEFAGSAETLDLFVTAGAVAAHDYDEKANRTTVLLDVEERSDWAWLIFRGTKRRPGDRPGSGFRDMTFMRPVAPGSKESHRKDELFSRHALELLAPFAIYRDLEHSEANTIPTPAGKGPDAAMAVTWADRVGPASISQGTWPRTPGAAPRGIAVEHRIALANAMGADLWACWPDTADDDYKRKFCLACRYGTDGVEPYAADQPSPTWPPLQGKLVIENSHDLWNYTNQQASRNLERARRHRQEHPGDLDWDGERDEHAWAQRFAARGAAAHEAIARSVWGDSGFKARYDVVLAGFQLDAAGTVGQGLRYLDNRGARPTNRSISLAGTGWFRQAKSRDFAGAGGVAGVVAEGLDDAPWLFNMADILEDPGHAGIEQAFYAGGASFAGDNDAETGFTAQVQADPAFGTLVRAAIDQQVAAGARHLVVSGSSQGPRSLGMGPGAMSAKYVATVRAIADLEGGLMPPPVERPRRPGLLDKVIAKVRARLRPADLAVGAVLLLALAMLAHDAARLLGPASFRRRPTITRRLRALAHAHPTFPLAVGFAAGVLAHYYWKRPR